jgi:transcriptional regulator with XRE-family HTH domain
METSEHVRVYNAQGLGAAVRHFRQVAGLTQAQLAAQVGVQRTYLSKLENGDMSDQVDRLVLMLKLTGARITVSKADW